MEFKEYVREHFFLEAIKKLPTLGCIQVYIELGLLKYYR